MAMLENLELGASPYIGQGQPEIKITQRPADYAERIFV
jgi:hypothetical protein